MNAAAEIGRNPVIMHLSLNMENEQDDAEQDGRTRPARTSYQARTGTGKYEVLIFPLQLTTSRNGNLTRLMYTLATCDDHTYIPFLDQQSSALIQ